MNRVLLICLLLLACSDVSEEKVKTMYMIDGEVMPYVLDFERDVKSIGLELNNSNKSFSVVLGRLPYRIAGIAIAMDNKFAVNVVLNIQLWHKLSDAEKRALVYHELAHDVYGLRHNTCDLMSGTLRSITQEMIDELLDTLTKQQNNGRLLL